MTGISCIKVGDICLAVDSNDPDFSQYFRRFYCHSIFDSTPDIWVTVHVVENIAPGKLLGKVSGYRSSSQVFGDGAFSIYDHLIHGELDLASQRCTIRVEMDLIAGECFSLFQDLLFRDLRYQLARSRNGGRGANAFLVHGCGVVHDGGGFLFLGPSGAGKSTIARLSSGDQVLHDEAVLLQESEGLYFIETTPYATEINCCPATYKAPLMGIFFLSQNHANSIDAITRPDAVSRMVRQVALPLAQDDRSRFQIMDENLSFATRIIENVPHHQLHFTHRDDSFWKKIDDLYR